MLTCKRAAIILVADWMRGMHSVPPAHMDAEEMEQALEQWKYRITEKRRQCIVEASEKIIKGFIDRLDQRIEDFNL